MSLKTDAAQLLERLRNAHAQRADPGRTHAARLAAATIAQDLIDEAPAHLLRAALIAAVQPGGGQPPIPVVLGPQDAAAATVGMDEVMGLIYAYATGCTEWGRAYERSQRFDPRFPNLAECHALERQIEAAHKSLRAAVEVLAAAAVLTDAARTAMGG